MSESLKNIIDIHTIANGHHLLRFRSVCNYTSISTVTCNSDTSNQMKVKCEEWFTITSNAIKDAAIKTITTTTKSLAKPDTEATNSPQRTEETSGKISAEYYWLTCCNTQADRITRDTPIITKDSWQRLWTGLPYAWISCKVTPETGRAFHLSSTGVEAASIAKRSDTCNGQSGWYLQVATAVVFLGRLPCNWSALRCVEVKMIMPSPNLNPT